MNPIDLDDYEQIKNLTNGQTNTVNLWRRKDNHNDLIVVKSPFSQCINLINHNIKSINLYFGKGTARNVNGMNAFAMTYFTGSALSDDELSNHNKLSTTLTMNGISFTMLDPNKDNFIKTESGQIIPIDHDYMIIHDGTKLLDEHINFLQHRMGFAGRVGGIRRLEEQRDYVLNSYPKAKSYLDDFWSKQYITKDTDLSTIKISHAKKGELKIVCENKEQLNYLKSELEKTSTDEKGLSLFMANKDPECLCFYVKCSRGPGTCGVYIAKNGELSIACPPHQAGKIAYLLGFSPADYCIDNNAIYIAKHILDFTKDPNQTIKRNIPFAPSKKLLEETTIYGIEKNTLPKLTPKVGIDPMTISADSQQNKTITIERVTAFGSSSQTLNNTANQVTLNCPATILTSFQELLRGTPILGCSFVNPYNGQTETIPSNADYLTSRHLQLLARNEKINVTGVMNTDLYNDKLTPHQIAQLRALVKATTVAGIVTAEAYGGYYSTRIKITNPQDQVMILIDQSGLQWQNDYRNTGGMFFYPHNLNHPDLPSHYAQWQSESFENMYGYQRPSNVSEYKKEFTWTTDQGQAVQGYLDLNLVAMAISVEFRQALDAAVNQTSLLSDISMPINFKFLKAGMGFFAEGLNQDPVERLELEEARLRGILAALNTIGSLTPQDQSVVLGRIKRIELPFSDVKNPSHQAILADIQASVRNLNIEWGGAVNIDALKPTPGFMNACTNAGDPHAMIGNEGGHSSVDASIFTNTKPYHLNACFNDQMQLRVSPALTPSIAMPQAPHKVKPIKATPPPVTVTPATASSADKPTSNTEKEPTITAQHEPNPAVKTHDKINLGISYQRPELTITCNNENYFQYLKGELSKNNLGYTVNKNEKSLRLDASRGIGTYGVYLSTNNEISIACKPGGSRTNIAVLLGLINGLHYKSLGDAGQNTIYLERTALSHNDQNPLLTTTIDIPKSSEATSQFSHRVTSEATSSSLTSKKTPSTNLNTTPVNDSQQKSIGRDKSKEVKSRLIELISGEVSRLKTDSFLTRIGIVSVGVDKANRLETLKNIIKEPDDNQTIKGRLTAWKKENHEAITKQRNAIHSFFSPGHQTTTLATVKSLFEQLGVDYDTCDPEKTHSPKSSN